jgi:rare lipoprotein A
MGITACSSDSDKIVTGNSGYYDSKTPKIEKQKVGRPYQVSGRWYTPTINHDYDETGLASWYGPGFDGRPTANGEEFDEDKISAAHKTLPLPSYVQVTNLDNGKQLYVRVNDRGPFVDDRIIDLSKHAAELLGSRSTGIARVRVRLAKPPYNVTLLSPDGKTIVGRKQKSSNQNTMLAQNEAIITNTIIAQNHTSHNLPLYQGIPNNPNPSYVQNEPLQPLQHTATQPTPPALNTPLNANLNDRYAVKIGVFSDANNVSTLQKNIASLGTVQVKPIYRNGQMLSEVALSGYKTQQEALNTVDALSQLGINDAIIINKN